MNTETLSFFGKTNTANDVSQNNIVMNVYCSYRLLLIDVF